MASSPAGDDYGLRATYLIHFKTHGPEQTAGVLIMPVPTRLTEGILATLRARGSHPSGTRRRPIASLTGKW
jgi:hypothetical protein